MKKSEWVTTTLITGGLVFSVLHHNAVWRDHYASREDCLADWGNNPANCEPASNSTSGAYSSGGYRGPTYERGSRPQTSQQHRISYRETVTRSGFGRSGARFSASS
jgi:hypothetical protein